MDESTETAKENAENQTLDPEHEKAKQSKPKNRKKLILLICGIAIILTAVAVLFFLSKKDEQNSSTSDNTEKIGDVITRQTFDCQARSEHEWYRTDHTLVVDHSNPDTLYVNVEYKGLFKSTDGGKTWTQKTKGIAVYARSDDKTKGCYGEYPVMRMDPTNPKRLILGVSGGGGGNLHPTNPNSQTGGVYQTEDGGENWEQMINNKMNFYVTDVVIDPKSTQTVYYGTASNPSSWTDADQNKIFVSSGLIYKTDDNGKNWLELPTGIGKNTSVTNILLNAANPNEIVAPTFSAKRQSADGSGTGVSTGKDTSVTQLGILKSVDGGKTWTTLAKTPSNEPIIHGFVSSKNFKHMFFVASGGESMNAYVMTDGTTLKATKYMDIVAYDPSDSNGNHLIGYSTIGSTPTLPGLNLHESNDGGITWKAKGTLPSEITDTNAPKTRPSAIVWHPTDKNTLYMSGAGGLVWKTTDLGATWTKLLDYTQL